MLQVNESSFEKIKVRMMDLTCKRENQDFFGRKVCSQRTCISGSDANTIKDISLKNYGHCANKYVKEMEKKTNFSNTYIMGHYW